MHEDDPWSDWGRRALFRGARAPFSSDFDADTLALKVALDSLVNLQTGLMGDTKITVEKQHEFIAAGLGEVQCATCGRSRETDAHTAWQNDQIGGDLSECPGCHEIWPMDLLVRMLRFRGAMHPGGVWVCKHCAGMRVDRYVELAILNDRGLLSDDEYVRRLGAIGE